MTTRLRNAVTLVAIGCTCWVIAAMIEDTIKILDRVGNGLRHGRHPNAQEADRLGRVLRGIATALGA